MLHLFLWFIPSRLKSKRVFTLLATSAPEKKIETWHFRFNFPHHTQAKVKSPPLEGLTNQLPHSLGTENRQIPGEWVVCAYITVGGAVL